MVAAAGGGLLILARRLQSLLGISAESPSLGADGAVAAPTESATRGRGEGRSGRGHPRGPTVPAPGSRALHLRRRSTRSPPSSRRLRLPLSRAAGCARRATPRHAAGCRRTPLLRNKRADAVAVAPPPRACGARLGQAAPLHACRRAPHLRVQCIDAAEIQLRLPLPLQLSSTHRQPLTRCSVSNRNNSDLSGPAEGHGQPHTLKTGHDSRVVVHVSKGSVVLFVTTRLCEHVTYRNASLQVILVRLVSFCFLLLSSRLAMVCDLENRLKGNFMKCNINQKVSVLIFVTSFRVMYKFVCSLYELVPVR